jgi:hypothetical protein
VVSVAGVAAPNEGGQMRATAVIAFLAACLVVAVVFARGPRDPDDDVNAVAWCADWATVMAAVDAGERPFAGLLRIAKAGVALGHRTISPAAADVVTAITNPPALALALQAADTIEAECPDEVGEE